MIDFTITIGNIIEVTAIIGGGLTFLLKTNNKVNTFTNDMTYLKEKVKSIADLVTSRAVMEREMEHIKEDIRELRHGEGFVRNVKLSKPGINKEYP